MIILLKNNKYKPSLMKMINKIKAGHPLWQSLHESKLFPSLCINLVRVGENSSNLTRAFKKCADIYKTKSESRKQLISMLSYPIFIILLSLFSLAIIVVAILPMFESVYAGFDVELPSLSSKMLIISNSIRKYGAATIAILISIMLLLNYQIKKHYLAWYHQAFLLIKYYRYEQYAQILENLGFLLDGGMEMYLALEELHQMQGNLILKERILQAKKRVGEGESLSEAFRGCKLFDEIAYRFILIGEETASLGKLLIEAGNIYQTRLQDGVKKAIKLFEPMATLIVGAVVALIALAVILPMASLIETIQ